MSTECLRISSYTKSDVFKVKVTGGYRGTTAARPKHTCVCQIHITVDVSPLGSGTWDRHVIWSLNDGLRRKDLARVTVH